MSITINKEYMEQEWLRVSRNLDRMRSGQIIRVPVRHSIQTVTSIKDESAMATDSRFPIIEFSLHQESRVFKGKKQRREYVVGTYEDSVYRVWQGDVKNV